MAIEDARSLRLVGLVALTPIDPVRREAEFHIFLGETGDRGRGLGRAATVATLVEGFEALGLRRIVLRVRASNLRARRLYESLGFTAEPAADAPIVEMALEAVAFLRAQARSATR